MNVENYKFPSHMPDYKTVFGFIGEVKIRGEPSPGYYHHVPRISKIRTVVLGN